MDDGIAIDVLTGRAGDEDWAHSGSFPSAPWRLSQGVRHHRPAHELAATKLYFGGTTGWCVRDRSRMICGLQPRCCRAFDASMA